jgi:hypothetical protein
MEVSGQVHVPAASPAGKWQLRLPFDRRVGGRQSRSGRGGEEKNLGPCRESNPCRPSVA